MITLIQTEENNRINVAFTDYNTLNPALDGYVSKIDGLWFGFNIENQRMTDGFANPVDAARGVIVDYENKAAAAMEKTIARMTAELEGADSSSLLVKAKIRMRDSLVAKLAAREFP